MDTKERYIEEQEFIKNKEEFIKIMEELYDNIKFTVQNTAGKHQSFSVALQELKKGKKARRTGWNGKGMWLELQRPDEHSKMTLPYLYLNYPKGDKYHNGCRVPWLASQTDLLEEDWEVFE